VEFDQGELELLAEAVYEQIHKLRGEMYIMEEPDPSAEDEVEEEVVMWSVLLDKLSAAVAREIVQKAQESGTIEEEGKGEKLMPKKGKKKFHGPGPNADYIEFGRVVCRAIPWIQFEIERDGSGFFLVSDPVTEEIDFIQGLEDSEFEYTNGMPVTAPDLTGELDSVFERLKANFSRLDITDQARLLQRLWDAESI